MRQPRQRGHQWWSRRPIRERPKLKLPLSHGLPLRIAIALLVRLDLGHVMAQEIPVRRVVVPQPTALVVHFLCRPGRANLVEVTDVRTKPKEARTRNDEGEHRDGKP